MPETKQRRLESIAAGLQERYGARALRRGDEMAFRPAVPAVSTGFAALDAITGCRGIPLGAITLLSGKITCGKLTVAYKMLASAQRSGPGSTPANVGLLDLSRTADPDYLARCALDLEHLLVARPPIGPELFPVLGELLHGPPLRALVIDNLAELAAHPKVLRQFHTVLGQLQHHLRATGCALIVLDEPSPPWQRWFNLDSNSPVRRAAALHIEMRREGWLHHAGALVGYQAQARLLKSRWVHGLRSAPVAIVFNGVVRARESW